MPEMVLKTRIGYGFNGFQVPTIPKAPRSDRRRGPLKKTVDDGQICAFELLAFLADKLLQENQSSSASSNASEGNDPPLISDAGITQEQKDENKPLIADCLNHGSHRESAFGPELGLRKRDGEYFLKEMPPDECDSILEHASVTRNSDFSEKLSSDVKSVFCNSEVASKDFRGVTEGGSPDLVDCNIEKGFVKQQEAEKLVAGYMTMNNANGSKYPMDLCSEFPALVNSGSKVKLPICMDPVPDASFIRHRNGVKLVSRDNDEKFLRSTKPHTHVKAFRTLTRTGDRRIRKLLTSKYWKEAPKLKDYDTGKTDGGLKPFLCHKRKIYQNHERCQYNSLYKRRKISDRNSVMISDGGFSSESISNCPEKGMNREKNGGNGVSPGVMGHQATFCSKDSHVKLSIKSFRVPEIFIEVPETTTVGSLKRTVMEALTSILGDGLHVGVVLRGKSIRDDNRTLSQTGISCKDNLDSLGFILESKIVQAPPPVCADDPCDTSELVSRSPVNPISDSSDALPNPPSLANSGKNVEFNSESVISHADTIVNHSRALVPVPAIMNIEALAMVPANQKPRRSEFVQRRTRRPFSVAEVEALVHAVEELGPGRWRDVKLRAFEDADHRTYVDLKDKWKTLVHTGEIAPQQRRGAPVPQELLDRVLAAHAYWSHHQIKQPRKPHPGIMNVSEVHSVKIEKC